MDLEGARRLPGELEQQDDIAAQEAAAANLNATEVAIGVGDTAEVGADGSVEGGGGHVYRARHGLPEDDTDGFDQSVIGVEPETDVQEGVDETSDSRSDTSPIYSEQAEDTADEPPIVVETEEVNDTGGGDGGGSPSDHEGGDSAETGPASGMTHVRGLRHEGDDETPVQNRPSQGAIVNAARAGEEQRISITRTEAGKNVRIEASDSLVPPDARTGGGQVQPGEQKFKYWARITSERRVPDPSRPPQQPATQQAGGASDRPNGMKVEDALSGWKNPFKIIVNAKAVAEDAAKGLNQWVGAEKARASRKYTRQTEAAQLGALQNDLNQARETALVNRTVVIGAETPEELDKLARHFASNGFHSGEQTIWSVEVDRDTQRAHQYNSAEEAIEAGKVDPNAYITAEQFTNEVRYPDKEIPGMTVEDNINFATNREIPEGEPSLRLGDIIDNNGNRGEELRVTLKDLKRHMLVAASSGSGKTVLLRRLAVDAILEDQQALNQETSPENKKTADGVPKHRSVVIVDFEKVGNYTDEVAGQLAGARMPDGAALPAERTKVLRIAPGAEGMRANINLLRLTGTTPNQQIGIATRSLTANITDPQAERVFSKFAGMAIGRAYEKLGWNMETDKSKYPIGTPATPDMEQVAIAVEEIMNETTFRSETKGDLEGFTKTELEDFLRGIPGQLFTGGYDIDWQKVREHEGVTVIELGRITSPEAKRIALTAIMRGMASALDMENPSGTDTDDTKLLMIMDETGGIFDDKTEAGKDNAHFFTNLRGKGVAMVIAQQGGLEDIHHDVTDSTSNFAALQMNNPRDIAWAAERFGVNSAKILKSSAEGRGLYIGVKMRSGPVQFATGDPKDIPRDYSNKAIDARSVVDQGFDPEFYSGSTKIEARDWLITDKTGTLVRAAAELAAGLVPLGRDPLKIAGPLKKNLTDMYNSEERQMLECAVVTAVTKAVDARPEIMYAARREEVTSFIIEDTMAQIAGTPRPVREDFDMLLDAGYYSQVKDAVMEVYIAGPVGMTPEIKAGLGRILSGRTAKEQLDSLKTFEANSVKAITAAIKAAAGNPNADVSAASVEMERLLGKAGAGNSGRVQARILESMKQVALSDDERAAFDKIVSGIRTGEEAPEVGYPDIRNRLETSIEAAKVNAAADLSSYEVLYGEEFEGATCGQQITNIQAKEATRGKTSRQKVSISNLLFAPDLIEGGLTMDRIVETLIKGAQRQGHVWDKQRRLHNQGQLEEMSLLEMYKRGDKRAAEWGIRIGTEILRSSNFIPTRATGEFLSRWVAEHVNQLRDIAKEYLEEELSKAKAKAGSNA